MAVQNAERQRERLEITANGELERRREGGSEGIQRNGIVE